MESCTVKVIGAKVYKPVRKLEPAMESVIPEEASMENGFLVRD